MLERVSGVISILKYFKSVKIFLSESGQYLYSCKPVITFTLLFTIFSNKTLLKIFLILIKYLVDHLGNKFVHVDFFFFFQKYSGTTVMMIGRRMYR